MLAMAIKKPAAAKPRLTSKELASARATIAFFIPRNSAGGGLRRGLRASNAKA
jgi:hypothetical protein